MLCIITLSVQQIMNKSDKKCQLTFWWYPLGRRGHTDDRRAEWVYKWDAVISPGSLWKRCWLCLIATLHLAAEALTIIFWYQQRETKPIYSSQSPVRQKLYFVLCTLFKNEFFIFLICCLHRFFESCCVKTVMYLRSISSKRCWGATNIKQFLFISLWVSVKGLWCLMMM